MRSAAQRHRINRVINFVRANVEDEIDLDRMADVACLSKYHFSRVFERHLGETPLRFVNRTRLECAARRLLFVPDRRIGSIAEDCGFESHQSFARAFRRHFIVPPSAFRDGTLPRDPVMPMPVDAGICERITVRIETRAPRRLAYIRCFGVYHRTGGNIRRAAWLIRAWALARGISPSVPLIGLGHDNRRITPAASCIYDVCIAVREEVVEDEIVSIMNVPAGCYAIATVCCRNEQLLSVWEWLSGPWREARALAPYTTRWSYESYPPGPGNRHNMLDPREGVDICLRLSPDVPSP